MAWRQPGDKPLSEPMMLSLLTHICITRPQWVKPVSALHHLTLVYCLKAPSDHIYFSFGQWCLINVFVHFSRMAHMVIKQVPLMLRNIFQSSIFCAHSVTHCGGCQATRLFDPSHLAGTVSGIPAIDVPLGKLSGREQKIVAWMYPTRFSDIRHSKNGQSLKHVIWEQNWNHVGPPLARLVCDMHCAFAEITFTPTKGFP